MTSWSLILNAQNASPEDYRRHMTRLAEIYWRPVYSFIRHNWRRSHEDAKDLTQEFFANAVLDRKLVDGYTPRERGFRSFLRVAIARFMMDWDRVSGAKKRGAGIKIESLERLGPVSFEKLSGQASRTPEQMFDVAWNEAVMKEAMALLEQQLTTEGRGAEFEAFKRYHYEGGSAELSYAQLAEAVGMTATQVRHSLSKVRKMLREIVTDVVGSYVDDPEELATELRALFGA